MTKLLWDCKQIAKVDLQGRGVSAGAGVKGACRSSDRLSSRACRLNRPRHGIHASCEDDDQWYSFCRQIVKAEVQLRLCS